MYALAAGTLYGISKPFKIDRRKDCTVTIGILVAPCHGKMRG